MTGLIPSGASASMDPARRMLYRQWVIPNNHYSDCDASNAAEMVERVRALADG